MTNKKVFYLSSKKKNYYFLFFGFGIIIFKMFIKFELEDHYMLNADQVE